MRCIATGFISCLFSCEFSMCTLCNSGLENGIKYTAVEKFLGFHLNETKFFLRDDSIVIMIVIFN